MRPAVPAVEDETELPTLLRYNLEKEGFTVSAAHDGEEALLQLKEAKPDAVLLDWMLPRVSGIEVCRQIRRTPAWRDLPGIMLTAHKVSRDGKPIHLGPTEFRLLRFLMERPGRVFSREQLLDAVWGRDAEVELRTVDVHIRRLRKALNEGGHKDLVRTVRAAGYALDSSVA